MKFSTFTKIATTTLCITALYAAASHYGTFGSVNASQEESTTDAPPPATPVQTNIAHPEAIQIWKHFSGNAVAVDQAEIRPQVDGRIVELRFENGQYVNEGDVLIVIDPRPFAAELARAEADLETAKVQVILAEKEYERAKGLINTPAISQSLLDTRINDLGVAKASVTAAQAVVDRARIDLDYAHIKAPISGKMSRAEITVGNLVQSGPNAPLLTSIVSDEKIYIDFEVDERTYLSFIREGCNKLTGARVPVKIQLPAGNIEYEGYVHDFDNRIDVSSGTIRARAIFDNPQKLLLPGLTVSVLMGSPSQQSEILVTERAIGTDQDRKFVYVIDGESKASYREVTLGESVDGKRIILSGLEEGDVVITEGLARIRPGMLVTPKAMADDTTHLHDEAMMEKKDLTSDDHNHEPKSQNP